VEAARVIARKSLVIGKLLRRARMIDGPPSGTARGIGGNHRKIGV